MSDGETLSSTQYLQKQIDQQKRLMSTLEDEVDQLKKQALVKTQILEEMTSTLSAMTKKIEDLYNRNLQCDM